MFTSHTLSTALFALIYARNVSARRGGGSGAEVSIHAPIDSMTAAIFAFNIIFAIFTFLQALKALGGLGKRRPGEDFPRRKPFTMILLLGILAQGTAYTLGAVYKMSLPTGSYWQKYTCALGHVFLYAGLLLLVDYRSKIQALQYGHKRSKPFVVALRSVSSVLLLLMFICLLLRSLLNFRNFGNPYYIFLASYIITTIVICGASITLWTNRRPLESQYDLLMYDAHVSPVLLWADIFLDFFFDIDYSHRYFVAS
jgi:hypothetical protein